MTAPISIRLTGLAFADHPRVPVALRGELIPWTRIEMRGCEARVIGVDGRVVRSGRFQYKIFFRGQASRVARRALRRAIRTGRLDVSIAGFTDRERLVSVAGWVIGNAVIAVFMGLLIVPGVHVLREAPATSHGPAVVLVATLTALLIWTVWCTVGLVRAEMRINVRRVRLLNRELVLEHRDGRVIQASWGDVRAVARFRDRCCLDLGSERVCVRVGHQFVFEHLAEQLGHGQRQRPLRVRVLRDLTVLFLFHQALAAYFAWAQARGVVEFAASPARLYLLIGVLMPSLLVACGVVAILGKLWEKRINRRAARRRRHAARAGKAARV